MRKEAQKVALEMMATENEVKDLKTRIRDTQGSLFEARAQIKAYERRLASVEHPDEPLPPETSSCVVCLGGDREMVFVPCGHVIACKSCAAARRSRGCPSSVRSAWSPPIALYVCTLTK